MVPLAIGAAVALATGLAWSVTGGYFWPSWVWFGVAVALTASFLLRRAWRVPRGRRRWLAVHRALLTVVAPAEVAVWALSGAGPFWPIWSVSGLSILFGFHALLVARMPAVRERELAARVDTLTRSRRGALDGKAAELERIERDLHDGAQARIVSLAMNLGLAESLLATDPAAAARLLADARAGAVGALSDLRTVMHEIRPAVLADRGLEGGVRALALDLALPVTVVGGLDTALPAALESAVYFSTAECLANAVKHSQATTVRVTLAHRDDVLTVIVEDNGRGGADLGLGTGLRGVAARLEAFDGRLHLDSPPGGPTKATITVDIPNGARPKV